jgi:hypothetical protein
VVGAQGSPLVVATSTWGRIDQVHLGGDEQGGASALVLCVPRSCRWTGVGCVWVLCTANLTMAVYWRSGRVSPPALGGCRPAAGAGPRALEASRYNFGRPAG